MPGSVWSICTLLVPGAALLVACATPASRSPAPAPSPGRVGSAEPTTAPDLVAVDATEPETLLVMPLGAAAGLEQAARSLDEMILTAIHGLGRYRVLGPADLSALLGVEQMKDAMGCDNVTCAAEIGGALGAPYLVAGQLGKLGAQSLLSLRLMDTQAPAVLERSTARGGASGDALATMMAAAVGGLFHVELAAPVVTAPDSASATEDYNEYTRIVTEIGRKMSNSEYSAMLADLDRYQHLSFAVPDGVDIAELFTYYRAMACSALARAQCLARAARTYRRRWPSGTYASAIESLLVQQEDARLHRDAAIGDLEQRLAEIDGLHSSGQLSEDQAQEMIAYAYFGARRHRKAAQLFARLLEHHRNNPDKAIEIVSILATVLEQAGDFGQARAVLQRAKHRHPRLFRLNGLHHHLRRLPQ